MTNSCTLCGQTFEITDDDLAFYEQVSPEFNGKKYPIPPPKRCPDCRMQCRMGWRNDRTLHHRKSDLTGKQIISMYSADKPYTVYDQEEWWADNWDALSYGRDFDFSKTFGENFLALSVAVPHISLYTTNNDNSYYTNHSLNLKNCYLIAGGGNDEDCIYGRFIVNSKNCVEGSSLYSCEHCYEGSSSERCYQCMFFLYSRGCTDCIMIEDCQSCTNCVCCFGLRNKEYCIMNEYVGKEVYEQRMKELKPLTLETIALLRSNLEALKLKLPHRQSQIFGSENCSGDMIFNSKNTHWSFDASGCEDSKYLCFTPKNFHSYDCTFNAPDGVEFCYDTCSTVGATMSAFTFLLWYGDNTLYSTECHRVSNCFGCVGLRNKKYCIFNKQYSKEEYETLVPKIIEHMQTTSEWGEFLPLSISRFAYNESVAGEFFPLTKEETLKRGWHWHDADEAEQQYMGPEISVPKTIDKTGDDICTQILRCEVTGRPYKVIPQELKFYRQMGIPVPRRSHDQRYRDRMALRNPRKLWTRACNKCGKSIETTYAPERPEIVYCEDCYLKTVY